jgi:hypothetical protein
VEERLENRRRWNRKIRWTTSTVEQRTSHLTQHYLGHLAFQLPLLYSFLHAATFKYYLHGSRRL